MGSENTFGCEISNNTKIMSGTWAPAGGDALATRLTFRILREMNIQKKKAE